MRILDTHLHLVYPDRFTYPWLSGAPAINREWTSAAYFAEAVPLGIESALHMEVDVAEKDIEAETDYVLTLPRIVGAIAACRPESLDFAAQIERLATKPGVKGVRRILHQAPDELSQSALFADNIRRLAAHGLSFDLCVRHDQLPIGKTLAEKAPEVTFILDHCGVPDVTGIGLNPWKAYISEIAKLPNVNAKISGIVAYSGADWTVETIRPYVEHVIESFGWDRVVWGSDHPVVTLTGSLTRWVEATWEIIRDCSEAEQAKLLHGNAERIYKVL
ncbi:4-sulfomuconolactone hydrolase [Devosia equisanguinis]|uniref:4-sulfomuconolactone hydrolase n=1 Tax=Devosia equisanguinis TaxID=2490941 RepID=A0A3S4CCG7_9HYPH|nr:amidohydrolase [Devosia equisanguinis]VDS05012.1 4-sulfomuconolactone hydrolase [Devosia equisanguinis]